MMDLEKPTREQFLTCRLTPDEARRLNEAARARGCQTSKLVRELLAPVLSDPTAPAVPNQAAAR